MKQEEYGDTTSVEVHNVHNDMCTAHIPGKYDTSLQFQLNRDDMVAHPL